MMGRPRSLPVFLSNSSQRVTLHRDAVLKHGTHDQKSHAGSRRRYGPDDESDGRYRMPKREDGKKKDEAEPDDDVIRTKDFDEALRLLSEGKRVELDSPAKAYTLVKRLHEFAQRAKKEGRNAPNLDLCKVSVPGTNLFCGGNLGIERKKMPQLSGKARKGSAADAMPKSDKGEVNVGKMFTDSLRSSGVEVRETTVPASRLRASQSQLVGASVGWMMSSEGQKALGIGTSKQNRIFVSRDGYVIDGHHRWAANVGLDSSDGSLGDVDMPVTMIDLPISEVLALATEFADEVGILPKEG